MSDILRPIFHLKNKKYSLYEICSWKVKAYIAFMPKVIQYKVSPFVYNLKKAKEK